MLSLTLCFASMVPRKGPAASSRFRNPAMSIMCVLAGYGWDQVSHRLQLRFQCNFNRRRIGPCSRVNQRLASDLTFSLETAIHGTNG